MHAEKNAKRMVRLNAVRPPVASVASNHCLLLFSLRVGVVLVPVFLCST